MKKVSAFLMLMTIIIGVIALSGCTKSHSIQTYKGDDLTKNATITASDDAKNIKKLTDGSQSSSWKTKTKGSYIEIDFGKPTDFNTIVLQEPSDSVKKFSIHALNEQNTYEEIYYQDRIDKYRMCAIEDTETNKIKIVFDEFDKKVDISNIEVYYIKNQKQDFVRQAYYSYGKDENGITEVQRKKDDSDWQNTVKTVTDIILFNLATLKSDGTIDVVIGKDKMKEDIKTIHDLTNNQVKVHVTVLTGLVSNDFKGNNKAMVKFSKEKLDDYSKNLREFVEYTGADGIDYDWEYPQLAWEWEAYNKLIIATKQAIGGRQLSVALWPYGVNFSKEARACIDRVNGMAYDQFDERGDHSSIYECGLSAIDYFLKKGFSKNQLLLGIPFYGRTSDERPYWPSYDKSYGKFDNYKKDVEYVDYDGVTKYTSTIYVNGYAMVRDKTALAIACDLRGIMLYQLFCGVEYSNDYSLSRAVENTVNQRLAD